MIFVLYFVGANVILQSQISYYRNENTNIILDTTTQMYILIL